MTHIFIQLGVILKSKSNTNGLYVFVTEGEIEIAGHKLSKRDAIGISETESFDIKSTKDAELVIIEVPMA